MKLAIAVLALLTLPACGVTDRDPSTGRKCAELPCGCLPTECPAGGCCANGEACAADGHGCYSPAPVVPWGDLGSKRGDAGADGAAR